MEKSFKTRKKPTDSSYYSDFSSVFSNKSILQNLSGYGVIESLV